MRAARKVLHTFQRAALHLGSILRKKPTLTITLPSLLLAGVAFFVIWQIVPHNKPTTPDEPTPITETPKERRTIDGVWVEKGQANPPLVAVMIENAADAQPLSGIDKAALIYEAPVEGAITRLMAVIPLPDDTQPDTDRIGPIRSVRPYYLNWATELGALLVHVGGSPAALDRIQAQRLLTLNEFFNGRYFERVRERRAPHNIYTSLTALRDAIQSKLPGTALERWLKTLPAWKFKDDAEPNERGTKTTVAIEYPGVYKAVWKYNTDNNAYTRIQWGGTDTLTDGSPITAKNIAVAVQGMAILDELGRKQLTTEGTGKAYMFRDGTAITGTWKKDSTSSRMRFFETSGDELQFNAGVTWIEIVPPHTNITY